MTLFTNKSTIISLFFSLLLSLTAFGQPSPINRRAFALASLAQSNIDADLKYWWDASDLPVQAVTNWIDKISGVIATNGDSSKRPSGTPSNVTFVSASSQSLTNAALSLAGFNTTIQIVCSVQSSPAFMGILSGGTGTKPEIYFGNLKPASYYQGLYQITAPTAMPSATNFDVVFTSGTGPSLGDIYTNGILAIHQTTSFQFNGITNIGTGADGFFNGTISEIKVWTSTFDAARVATVHSQATNKWKYAP